MFYSSQFCLSFSIGKQSKENHLNMKTEKSVTVGMKNDLNILIEPTILLQEFSLNIIGFVSYLSLFDMHIKKMYQIQIRIYKVTPNFMENPLNDNS